MRFFLALLGVLFGLAATSFYLKGRGHAESARKMYLDDGSVSPVKAPAVPSQEMDFVSKTVEPTKARQPQPSRVRSVMSEHMNAMQEQGLLDGVTYDVRKDRLKDALRYDPTTYEEVLLDSVKTLENPSGVILAIDVYVENHDGPGPVVEKILEGNEKANADRTMVKASTVEALGQRLDVGRDFVTDPLPNLRRPLVEMLKRESSLSLRKEALVFLRDRLAFGVEELGSLIDGDKEGAEALQRMLRDHP